MAAAEMCIGGRLGMDLELDTDSSAVFFSETNAALLVEVGAQNQLAFEACFNATEKGDMDRPAVRICRPVGRVTADSVLRISTRGRGTIELPVEKLAAAWGAQ